MKLAIIGPPFSGKTTVFNGLTGANEPMSDFSGGGDVHKRVVPVPDVRLERLRADWNPKKFTPATVEIGDLPGYGGEKFWGVVREHEALVIVVRAFKNDSVPHPKQRVDWKKDLEDIKTDLVVQDLSIVEKRAEKLEKSSKKPSKTQKDELEELALLQRVKPFLEAGTPIRRAKLDLKPAEVQRLAGFQLLTLKPSLSLVNIGDEDDAKALGIPDLPALGADHRPDDLTIAIKGRLEMEVAQLPESDRAGFLADFGIQETIAARLVRLAYYLLDQISFLTAGDKEVRAWTITRGDNAVEAARKIHSDIARGFIRAEVVSWADYLATGSLKAAKEANKLRLEGRDYLMKDGDVVEFRHGA